MEVYEQQSANDGSAVVCDSDFGYYILHYFTLYLSCSDASSGKERRVTSRVGVRLKSRHVLGFTKSLSKVATRINKF